MMNLFSATEDRIISIRNEKPKLNSDIISKYQEDRDVLGSIS